jgi:hypothetical protein
MLFNRTHSFSTSFSPEILKSRLLGSHVKIHNVDFEIIEDDDNSVSIMPHAEQIEEVKTLPDTTVRFVSAGAQTRVVIFSRIREFDQGPPMLIMISCALVYAAAAVLHFVFHYKLPTYIVLGVGALITIGFIVRMQTGYLDYVKKVRKYVVDKSLGNG